MDTNLKQAIAETRKALLNVSALIDSSVVTFQERVDTGAIPTNANPDPNPYKLSNPDFNPIPIPSP